MEDAVQFLDWLPTSHWARWRPIFLFALATGMRRGEMLALRREWIDASRGVIWVGESIGECNGEVYEKLPKIGRPREQLFQSPRLQRCKRRLQYATTIATCLAMLTRIATSCFPTHMAIESDRTLSPTRSGVHARQPV